MCEIGFPRYLFPTKTGCDGTAPLVIILHAGCEARTKVDIKSCQIGHNSKCNPEAEVGHFKNTTFWRIKVLDYYHQLYRRAVGQFSILIKKNVAFLQCPTPRGPLLKEMRPFQVDIVFQGSLNLEICPANRC